VKISNGFTFGIILLVFMVAIAWMAPAVHAAIDLKVDQGIEILTGDLGTPEVAPDVSAIIVACVQCLKIMEEVKRTMASAPDLYETKGLYSTHVQIFGVVKGVGSPWMAGI